MSGELMQRERALQVLEYQANALVHGVPSDPAQLAALLREIPEGKLEARPAGEGMKALTVRWRSPQGESQRTLVVFARKP